MKVLTIFLASLCLAIGWLLIPATSASAQADITGGLCTGANLQLTDAPTGNCNDNGATTSINNLIHTIINLLSAVVGIVAVIMIIVGGLRYITSGGNDASVSGAKNTILYAVVGLIIVALAQLVVRFVLNKVANS